MHTFPPLTCRLVARFDPRPCRGPDGTKLLPCYPCPARTFVRDQAFAKFWDK